MHISLSCTFAIEWDHFLGKVCVLVVCSAGQHPSPKLIRIMQTNLWKMRGKKISFQIVLLLMLWARQTLERFVTFLIWMRTCFNCIRCEFLVCVRAVKSVLTHGNPRNRHPMTEWVRSFGTLIWFSMDTLDIFGFCSLMEKMVAPNEIWNENATTIPSCWVATIKMEIELRSRAFSAAFPISTSAAKLENCECINWKILHKMQKAICLLNKNFFIIPSDSRSIHCYVSSKLFSGKRVKCSFAQLWFEALHDDASRTEEYAMHIAVLCCTAAELSCDIANSRQRA